MTGDAIVGVQLVKIIVAITDMVGKWVNFQSDLIINILILDLGIISRLQICKQRLVWLNLKN